MEGEPVALVMRNLVDQVKQVIIPKPKRAAQDFVHHADIQYASIS